MQESKREVFILDDDILETVSGPHIRDDLLEASCTSDAEPAGAVAGSLRGSADKAFTCRQEGEANLRAATQVNAVSASLPVKLNVFLAQVRDWAASGAACPAETDRVR